jgi:Flp pilus assembly CpaF family ATPase
MSIINKPPQHVKREYEFEEPVALVVEKYATFIDRIILGEIRGGEAFDLLQLLNTGARFTSCVLQSGVDLPYRAIKTNTADSLGVVVQLERRPGRRFVSEVVEVNRYDPDLDEYDFGVIYQARKEQP